MTECLLCQLTESMVVINFVRKVGLRKQLPCLVPSVLWVIILTFSACQGNLKNVVPKGRAQHNYLK